MSFVTRSALNIWHINITITVNLLTTSIVRLIYQMDTLYLLINKRDIVQYGTKAITVTPFQISQRKPLKYRLTESKVNHMKIIMVTYDVFQTT
ncbi:hypothetical protein DMI66_25420 [Escherichia coli]|nr:hypothetical protein [Escherichia coli]